LVTYQNYTKMQGQKSVKKIDHSDWRRGGTVDGKKWSIIYTPRIGLPLCGVVNSNRLNVMLTADKRNSSADKCSRWLKRWRCETERAELLMKLSDPFVHFREITVLFPISVLWTGMLFIPRVLLAVERTTSVLYCDRCRHLLCSAKRCINKKAACRVSLSMCDHRRLVPFILTPRIEPSNVPWQKGNSFVGWDGNIS
jgi:hypothetical protein